MTKRKATLEDLQQIVKENALGLRELRSSQKETDRQMKETEQLIKGLAEQTGNLGNRWGDFMESLVKGDLVQLFKLRDIRVERLASISKFTYKKKEYEYDLIAINGSEVVVVEVKSHLYVKEVKEFIEKLKVFRQVCHEYKDKVIYGAVAYLKANQSADEYAKKQKLFVIKAPGGKTQVSTITNALNFKPAKF